MELGIQSNLTAMVMRGFGAYGQPASMPTSISQQVPGGARPAVVADLSVRGMLVSSMAGPQPTWAPDVSEVSSAVSSAAGEWLIMRDNPAGPARTVSDLLSLGGSEPFAGEVSASAAEAVQRAAQLVSENIKQDPMTAILAQSNPSWLSAVRLLS